MNIDYFSSILLIGTQRSGSNLLRVILNQIDHISAPHPPHIINTFYPLLSKYGSLENEDNFKRLIGDISHIVNINPVKWLDYKLKSDLIYDQTKTKKSLISIFEAIYRNYSAHHGKTKWCCKSLANVNHISLIEGSGIDPKYIHIVRDGRDVAASFKKTIVGPKHIFHIAQTWKKEQELALALKATKGHYYHQIKYEELIEEPEVVLEKLCHYLSTQYSEKLLTFYTSKESIETAKSGLMWQNVINPIDSKNKEKFKTELSIEEIQIFESIAGDTLQKLGYKLTLGGNKIIFNKKDIEHFDTLNNKKKELILSSKEAKIDLQIRSPRIQFLEKIRNS